MLAPFILLLAQVGAAATRPPECGASEGLKDVNVWERVKHPELRKYCDLIASGASKLAGTGVLARDVLAVADEAEKAMPGKAAPLALRGRALAKLGQPADAYAAFLESKKRDPNALDDASTLYAFARSAARSNHTDDARDAFRALLPRASGLPGAERGAAYVEAGLLMLMKGPVGVEEALATLLQARRETQDTMQTVAWLGLALALDRSGARDQAKALLDEKAHGDPRVAMGDLRVRDALGVVLLPEADAMLGVGLERTDPAAARDAWKRYIANPQAAQSPWLDHAKAKDGAPPKVKPK